jgi:hypothetical protein
MSFKEIITICIFPAVFSIVTFENASAQQWKDVSAKGRKETVWCVDIPTGSYPFYLTKDVDSLSVVGWNSSKGILLQSSDDGANWNSIIFPTLFPVSMVYRSDGSKIIAGYNYLTDNAEVVFLGGNGTILKTYSFDGDSLPYSRNIFDMARVSDGFLACGTNTSILKYSFKDSSWKQVFQPLNDTMIFYFTRIQTFIDPHAFPPTKFCGLVLAGESYDKMHILYKTVDEGNSWLPVYDFHQISPQVELFGFFAPMFEHPELNEIFVSGSIADTAVIWYSNDGGNTWNEFFRQETLNNIIGLYVTGGTKDLIAVSDKGEVWVGNYWNGELKKVQDAIPDQFLGVRFFEKFRILTQGQEGAESQTFVFGFGLDGSIRQYNLDLIINVEEQPFLPELKFYDEVVIFNLLGKAVERRENFEVDGAKNLDFLPSGIYFIAKKLNGQVLEMQGVIKF